MKTSSELRAEARNNLSKKFGEAIVISLLYFAITSAINIASQFIPFASILLLAVTVPFSYALVMSFLKLKRNDNFSYGDIFTLGFNNFGKIWSVVGNTLLKLIVPIILLIVSIAILVAGAILISVTTGNNSSDSSTVFLVLSLICIFIGVIMYFASLVLLIMRNYYYSLTYYLLYDNPNMSGKEIVALSESIMKGQRANLFLLQLSFIGWALLAICTCGVGFLFLEPYIQFATIAFYEDRTGKLANTDNN